MVTSSEQNERKITSTSFPRLFSIIFIQVVLLLSFISAYDTHQQNTDFIYVEEVANADSCNVTSSEWILPMNKNSFTFTVNLSASNFTEIGETCWYIVCYDSDADPQYVSSRKCLDVNPSGLKIDDASSNIYIGGAVIVFLLFLLSLYFAINIPFEDVRDYEGNILQVSYKKYLKFFMAFISYLTLMFLTFILKGMSYSFLASTEIYGFFNVASTILLVGLMPILILSSVFLIFSHITDKKVSRALERGIPVQ